MKRMVKEDMKLSKIDFLKRDLYWKENAKENQHYRLNGSKQI